MSNLPTSVSVRQRWLSASASEPTRRTYLYWPALLGRLARTLVLRRLERRALQQLDQLDDRLLRDIGLSRDDGYSKRRQARAGQPGEWNL